MIKYAYIIVLMESSEKIISIRKFLFTVLFISICHISIVNATVQSGTDSAINYQMSYPLVYTANPEAQEKINTDIYQYIQNFRTAYQNGAFINGNFSYWVKYEDDQYASLILCDSRYYGGAHSLPSFVGLTYDKQTGEKVPLSFFVKLRPEDKYQLNRFPVYAIGGENISRNTFSRQDPPPVSANYFLLGGGDIALIYQPYVLAAFVYGMTYIKLTPKWIDYFNRKNHD